MKRFILNASLALGLLAASSAHASLIGEQVTGRLSFGGGSTNYFAPANGFVPAGYLNSASATVTIAEPAIEFGFKDGANTDIANFTGSQLIITDDVLSSASNWLMTFTSLNPNLFQGISLAESSFSGLTYSLANDTITVNWNGTNSPANFRAVFNVETGNKVPEPASLALLGLGLVGLVASRRRKTA